MAQAANLPAVQQPTAVAPIPQRAAPLSMDDMAAGSITVDAWLGVKDVGFIVGPAKKIYLEPIKVQIDLVAVAPCFAVKFGNPATYYKTYDHVTEARGGSWAEALAKASRVDPNAREYRSADIPMRLMETISIKNETIHEVGVTLGYSLSTTNWGAWEAFYKECLKSGFAGQTVNVELNFEPKTNAKGNRWGIITFKRIADA
ncbi:MAG TPA: hypothetical protein PLD10_16250 [Rhodopila sp.]|nr:hypothetical protein [Rhodopila sp.]